MLDHIPRTIVVQAEALQADSELRKDIRRAQDAYADLLHMPDFDCPTLKEFNTAEIDKLTAERIARVQSSPDLLHSEKVKRISEFKALHRAVVTKINLISKVLSKWPKARLACDQYLHTLTPQANLESVVSSMCTHVVPPMAQQHAQLINNTLTAISQLREFEQANNITKMRLEQIAHMDTETFAAKWASGEIHRPQIADETMRRDVEFRRQIFEKTYI